MTRCTLDQSKGYIPAENLELRIRSLDRISCEKPQRLSAERHEARRMEIRPQRADESRHRRFSQRERSWIQFEWRDPVGQWEENLAHGPPPPPSERHFGAESFSRGGPVEAQSAAQEDAGGTLGAEVKLS